MLDWDGQKARPNMPTRPYTVIKAQTYAPQGQQVGDQWFNTGTNALNVALPVNGTTLTNTQVLIAINGNVGNATNTLNTIFARSTSSSYADLAEMYRADAEYTPGTVLCFAGEQEVTISTANHANNVAGVVSQHPSYIMNAGIPCDHPTAMALQGRVPTQVVGKIRKGDRMVASDIPGVATAMDPARYEPGCVIGKALSDYDSQEPGTIEVVVGRL
jgi:hypothetical protein